MRKLFCLLLLSSYVTSVSAQALHIDSTCFLPTTKCCGDIYHAIPTADKGLFFVGVMGHKPGGVIPTFLLDTVLQNVMIGKMDSNRHISWVKVYGGTQEDVAISACQTPDGGYAVLAATNSSNGDVTGFKGGVDIWLLRIDANGNLLWQKTYGSTQSDDPISITSTPDHGFIILGSTNGSDGDVPFHYGGFFSLDWLVVKTDSVGNVQWTKNIGGTQSEDEVGSILSVDTCYYLVSSTTSTDYDCSDTTWHPGAYTADDFHLIKLGSSGNVLWDKSYGGSNYDIMSSAIFDARDGTIVLIGYTYSNDRMVTGFSGDTDMWVVKLNKNGSLVWEKTIGGAGEENGQSACEAPHGGYAVFGTTRYVIGGGDGWLSILDSSGNEVSQKIFGGTDNDGASSIIPSTGGYATVGTSASHSFTEGINCNANNSGSYMSYWESWPLTVDNLYSNKLMNIYPNPANDKVNAAISGMQNGSMTIMNIMGQVVYKIKITAQTTIETIDVGEWATGVYIIHVQDNYGGITTGKFIKE